MWSIFEGPTADAVFCQAAAAIGTNGVQIQCSRGGVVRELMNSVFSIADPRQRWTLSRTPALNPAFALAEVVWIMNGRNDAAFVNYFNRQLSKYAGSGGTYHGAYGYRLRAHLGMDQLERAYEALRNASHSRQIVLQYWDGRIDLPDSNGTPRNQDIPCNVASMVAIREGVLHWTQLMRSNDLFLGFPHNVIQFTTLQEVFAGWLGVKVGSYQQLSNSLHVYERALPSILSTTPLEHIENTDHLLFSKQVSEFGFHWLAEVCDAVRDPDTGISAVNALPERTEMPQSFRNIAYVLCAEGARRRQQTDLAVALMKRCTNVLYRQLFKNWLDRVNNTSMPSVHMAL